MKQHVHKLSGCKHTQMDPHITQNTMSPAPSSVDNGITMTNIPWAVRLSWLKNAYSCLLFRQVIMTRKVGQTDLVLACDQCSLVGRCMQDYKSLCVALAIRSTLVNIQTDTFTHKHRQQLTSLSDKLSQLS